jgi:hypothetical protein
MASEQKLFFMSLVFIIGINLLVAPLVQGDSSELNLPDLTPPDNAIGSPEFQTPGFSGGWTDAITSIGQVILGIFVLVGWFILTLSSIVLGGFVAHPLLSLLNFLVGVVAIVSFIKLLPWT